MPARSSHTAVWTGSEMIVWGGLAGSSNYLSSGKTCCAQFVPATSHTPTGCTPQVQVQHRLQHHLSVAGDIIPLPTVGQPPVRPTRPTAEPVTPQYGPAAEMIVWGGSDDSGYLNTGGRYNPSTRQLDGHQHHQRARCPLSHGGMDRQRNDCLGRIGRSGYLNTGGEIQSQHRQVDTPPTSQLPQPVTPQCGLAAK